MEDKEMIKEQHRVSLCWWNRISEYRRIKYAEDEQWTTPDQLNGFQIRQIYCEKT